MVQFYFFKAIVAISTIARELPRTHIHYLLGYESPIWMRKDLLFCNTENHVKLAFPLFWVRFNFCCFKSWQPPIRYLFLCASLHRLKPSLHSSVLQVPLYFTSGAENCSCKRKEGDMLLHPHKQVLFSKEPVAV